jgi:8-oxo-dGTP pyrophosphatase MutT (NUDIX family)
MLFRPPAVQQVAILPFVPLAAGHEVLLVTSRKGGRWILPKGWPMKDRPPSEAARAEGVEEAGVEGLLGETPVGSYRYAKAMPEGYRVRAEVFVYPLLVSQHRIDWPERGERALRWCGLAEAARLVEDRGLVQLLGDLARDGGAALERAAAALDKSGSPGTD